MMLTNYEYRCSAGETFDSVSRSIWGDERWAADLMTANVLLAEKMVFTGGERLRIPVVDTVIDSHTGQQIGDAPWKQEG